MLTASILPNLMSSALEAVCRLHYNDHALCVNKNGNLPHLQSQRNLCHLRRGQVATAAPSALKPAIAGPSSSAFRQELTSPRSVLKGRRGFRCTHKSTKACLLSCDSCDARLIPCRGSWPKQATA